MPSRVSQNPRLFLQDLPGKGLQGALVCTHHAHAERGLPREAEQPGKKQGSCGHPDPLALLGLADILHLLPTRSWAAIHQAHLEQIFWGPMALLRGSARSFSQRAQHRGKTTESRGMSNLTAPATKSPVQCPLLKVAVPFPRTRRAQDGGLRATKQRQQLQHSCSPSTKPAEHPTGF